MRRLIVLGVLFGTIWLVGACSDDDKRADIVVPPLADDTLTIRDTAFKLKLVDTIRISYVFENGNNAQDFLCFTYDGQKRISRIHATEDGETVEVSFAYVSGQMAMTRTNEKGARVYSLSDGIARSMHKKDAEDDVTDIVYDYDNENHLIKVTGNYIAAGLIYKDTIVFEWQENNMISYRLRDFCNVPGYAESYEDKFRATKALNNYNIDLNIVLLELLPAVDIYGGNSAGISRYTDYAGFCGIYGKKSKNILEYEEYEQKFFIDKEGYLTKIIKSDPDGMTATFTISYR